MEEVWLKAEPIDDKFDVGIITNAVVSTILPVPYIKKEEPEDASEDTLEECYQSTEHAISYSQAMSDVERKLTVEGSVRGHKEKSSAKTSEKKVEKNSYAGMEQQKKLKEKSTAGKVEKKLSRKETQKRRYCCEECGKEFNQSYHLNRHKLLHSGIEG